jgi:hypothetical protein
MRLFCFLAFFPVLVFAQPDFLKDPDIVWAVELEQDWVLEIPLETEIDHGITTLKLLFDAPYELYQSAPNLSGLVFKSAAEGKLAIFSDESCSVRMDWASLFKFSDNHSFNPDTQEETMEIGFTHYEPDAVKLWRLKQVLAYHQKEATWSTHVEAIAPLLVIKNEEGDSVGTRPMFWFRPDNKPQKLSTNRIVWAKRVVNKQPQTQIPIIQGPLLKSAAKFPGLLPEIRAVVEHRIDIPLYHGTQNKLLGPEERSKLIARADTIYVERSNGQGIDIIYWDILNDITKLRLVQTWYWDAQRNGLSICLDAVAPMRDFKDDAGDFRYSAPLFYRRTRK